MLQKERKFLHKGTSQLKLCPDCLFVHKVNETVFIPETYRKIFFSLNVKCKECLNKENKQMSNEELMFFEQLEEQLDSDLSLQMKDVTIDTQINGNDGYFYGIEERLNSLLYNG